MKNSIRYISINQGDMRTLKYTVIKTGEQYNNYCNILENLISEVSPALDDEIELLTLLIEKWDSEHSTFNDLDPVQLIKSLMEENNLKAVGLAKLLGLSKGTVSKILNYQKGLSKETIRKLSENFQITQEAFNRPYKLKNEINRQFRDASLMNTKKDLGASLAI